MPTFDATDLDNAASESGVVHQNTANTDHTDASQLKQGYDYQNFSEITPDPVACWPLHEDSGTTAYDKAGTNDGTYNGPTLNQTGLLGTSAISCDGTDDSTQVGDSASLDVTGDITVSVWLKQVSQGDRSQGVVSKAGDASTGYSLTWSTNHNLYYLRTDGSGNSVTSGVGITPTVGEWEHIVATLSNGTLTYYKNGVEGDNTSASLSTTNNTSLYIGRNSWSSSDVFDGYITDARVYNRALTASEVQTLYDVVATKGDLTTQFKTV